jgi:hypothetical protein
VLLTQSAMLTFAWWGSRTSRKSSVSAPVDAAEIRTDYLSNANLHSFHTPPSPSAVRYIRTVSTCHPLLLQCVTSARFPHATLSFCSALHPHSFHTPPSPSAMRYIRTVSTRHPLLLQCVTSAQFPHATLSFCDALHLHSFHTFSYSGVSPSNAICIATYYGLGFESRWGQEFSLLHIVQTGSGAHSASYPTCTKCFPPGLKRQGREADHSPPTSAEL